MRSPISGWPEAAYAGDPVRNSLGAADAQELTVEAGLEQGFVGAQLRQSNVLMQAARSNGGHPALATVARWVKQIVPRHALIHFLEQDLLAGTSLAEVKVEVVLLHAANDRNLHALVTMIAGEF